MGGEEGRGEETQGRPEQEQGKSDALICIQETCRLFGPTSGLLTGNLHFNKIPGLG